MPNQFKTRIQAIDATTHYRRWVELEADGNGIKITILDTRPDGSSQEIAKVYSIRDEFVGFIIGYLISGIGAYDNTIKDLIYSIAKQIVEHVEARNKL